MTTDQLIATANAMVAPGKGILAADESSGTIKKRFKSIGVESTEDNRRDYRELLFTTPGAGDYISGVILFDETIRQSAADGTSLVELLTNQNIIPGIKVDAGAKPLAGSPNETVTEGLDGLRKRLNEYYELGARFTKWRAVIRIGGHAPSRHCIHANAEALARYAALSQEAGLVPIVEPEVLMDGDHSLERCARVTEATQHVVFRALRLHKVVLEGIVLKPNMVVPGADHDPQASVEKVAEATLQVLNRTVPAAVPGIAFLSGGQSDADATAHLNAMNAMADNHPWQLTFSYGRALQAAPLKAWAGQAANGESARQAFHRRAELNGAARYGRYDAAMEQSVA
ncbi:MAG: class I fructose-bisphosphate aldolase [Alphaproteobacteria bacterium]